MNEQECQAKGGKLVDGKCEMPNVIPSTSGFKSKKMSNNPFKMWGSWVGAILFSLPLFDWMFGLGMTKIPLLEFFLRLPPSGLIYLGDSCYGKGLQVFVNCSGAFIFGLSGIIFGFLAGWGITMLVRRYKK